MANDFDLAPASWIQICRNGKARQRGKAGLTKTCVGARVENTLPHPSRRRTAAEVQVLTERVRARLRGKSPEI